MQTFKYSLETTSIMSDQETLAQKDPFLEQLIADHDWLEMECPNDIGGVERIEGNREGTIYPIGDAGYQFIFWGDESVIHGFKVRSEGEHVVPLTPTTQIISYRDNTLLQDGKAIYGHSLGYAERMEILRAANTDAVVPPMPQNLQHMQTN